MNMKYIIAVDLGGTITKVGLLRNGELVDLSLIHISNVARFVQLERHVLLLTAGKGECCGSCDNYQYR